MKVIHQLGAIVRNITASGIVLSMALGWAAVAPRPAQADTAAPVAQHAATATGASHDTIAIAFQTNWKSVADECTRTYGPEGVGYVQISPRRNPFQARPGGPPINP